MLVIIYYLKAGIFFFLVKLKGWDLIEAQCSFFIIEFGGRNFFFLFLCVNGVGWLGLGGFKFSVLQNYSHPHVTCISFCTNFFFYLMKWLIDDDDDDD